MLNLAKTYIKPRGWLVTLDGGFAPEQSPFARILLQLDRGRYIRSAPEYAALAHQVYSEVKVSVRHDMFRFPYTCVVMECLP